MLVSILFQKLIIFLRKYANVSVICKKIKCWVSVSGNSSITAAVKFVTLVVQHNTFFNIIDHLAPLIRKKYSTSRAGRNLICDKKQLLLPTASEITSLMN